MSRIKTTALFAALFFLVGLLSGNFMAPQLQSQTEAELVRSDDEPIDFIPQPEIFDGVVPLMLVDPPAQQISDQTAELTFPNTSDVTDGSSFSEFAETQIAAGEFIADTDEGDVFAETIADSELTQASEADVLASIEFHFPDLPTHVKSGWVDTYCGMPLDELNILLEQKKLMPSILQVSNSFLQPGADINIQPVERIPQTPIHQLRSTVINNLRNAATVGYRRGLTNTSLAVPTPETSSDRITTSTAAFDFTPGAISVSNNSLHVAIQHDPFAMFRLEPGCVLTRNGQFERLDDGRLGVQGESVSLALSGVEVIPTEAVNVAIAEDGTVTYRHNDVVKSAGKISLVRVTAPESLLSQNGVYFTLTSEVGSQPLEAADNASLASNSFEESNVIIEREWQLLDHFERLQALSADTNVAGKILQ